MNIIITSVLLPIAVSLITTLVTTKVLDLTDGFMHSKSRNNSRKESRKSGYIQIFVRGRRSLQDIDAAKIDSCLMFFEEETKGVIKEIDLTEVKRSLYVGEMAAEKFGNCFIIIEIMNNNKDRSMLKEVVFQDLLSYKYKALQPIDNGKIYRLSVESTLQPEAIEFSDGNSKSIYKLSDRGEEFVLEDVLDIEVKR